MTPTQVEILEVFAEAAQLGRRYRVPQGLSLYQPPAEPGPLVVRAPPSRPHYVEWEGAATGMRHCYRCNRPRPIADFTVAGAPRLRVDCTQCRGRDRTRYYAPLPVFAEPAAFAAIGRRTSRRRTVLYHALIGELPACARRLKPVRVVPVAEVPLELRCPLRGCRQAWPTFTCA